MNKFDTGNETIEAEVFRRLLQHLDDNKEVQNIELMLLADFCRNCLAKWYLEASTKRGIDMDYDRARELIYGMPFDEWKALYQTKATDEQLKAFAQKQAIKEGCS